ncbi:hypothetical protein BN903_20 [Halorubrum sp. AJ67]|nr:hypothetical protein BN903_20 [Halorubrum sp. AJ67]
MSARLRGLRSDCDTVSLLVLRHAPRGRAAVVWLLLGTTE